VGTGLGLSVSGGIIEGMGGLLSAHNGAEGACFVIELPVQSIN
jgi:two-component system cell cycle sensor histidine kinase/response regulator CckA